MSDKKHLAGLDSGYVPDPRHQTLTLDPDVVDELLVQAARLERSRSWLLQLAWKIAKKRIQSNQAPL